jgi:hypothetical protein
MKKIILIIVICVIAVAAYYVFVKNNVSDESLNSNYPTQPPALPQ